MLLLFIVCLVLLFGFTWVFAWFCFGGLLVTRVVG